MLKRRTERRAVARQEHETLQIVAFRVGAELYGFEIGSVQEIDLMQPVTRVPQSLSLVGGGIHGRGAIIPVTPFIWLKGMAAVWTSIILSAGGLFLIGAAITLVTGKPVIRSGLRQLAFALAAALLTYTIGHWIGVNIAG